MTHSLGVTSASTYLHRLLFSAWVTRALHHVPLGVALCKYGLAWTTVSAGESRVFLTARCRPRVCELAHRYYLRGRFLARILAYKRPIHHLGVAPSSEPAHSSSRDQDVSIVFTRTLLKIALCWTWSKSRFVGLSENAQCGWILGFSKT